MKATYLNFVSLEFKRAYKTFPKILAGALILLIITGFAAFLGEKILYSKGPDKATVAFTTEDKSKLIPMAKTLLQSSESIASICNFINTDKAHADQLVSNNEVVGSVTIPEGFIHGLATGESIPINIKFADNMTVLAGLLKELTYTATRTLASTQSGIFAQADFYNNHKAGDKLKAANKDLNEEYLGFVFARATILNKETISVTGSISVKDHYMAGGLSLFFIMFSIAFMNYIMNDKKSFKNFLFQKINPSAYFLTKILVIASMYYVVYLITAAIVLVITSYNLFRFAFVTVFISISIASFVLLLYNIASSRLAAVMLTFAVTIISAFLSGCLIPTAYLPQTLKTLGNLIPTTHIINVFAGIIGHSLSTFSVIYLICFIPVCLALTVFVDKKGRCF